MSLPQTPGKRQAHQATRRGFFVLFLVVIFFVLSSASLGAQQLPPADPLMPEDYDPEEFPMWAHDLRRFEVISIGSFPITFLLGSLVYDFSLAAANNFDQTYGMGTQRSNKDIGIIIGSAAAASLVIATIDLIINVSKRREAKTDQSIQGNPNE